RAHSAEQLLAFLDVAGRRRRGLHRQRENQGQDHGRYSYANRCWSEPNLTRSSSDHGKATAENAENAESSFENTLCDFRALGGCFSVSPTPRVRSRRSARASLFPDRPSAHCLRRCSRSRTAG